MSTETHKKSKGIMRKLNAFTGIAFGLLLGFTVNYLARKYLAQGEDFPFYGDQVIISTMIGWALGFMIGVGAFVGPYRWLMNRDLSYEDQMWLAGKDAGTARYFRFTTDHKVVGIQYLVMTMVLLGVGGTLAMMIRTQLSMPNNHFINHTMYNSFVGLHGIIMIIATIIMVTGPFGNFILPIMIGARDMAFPRLNALSFWLIFAAVPILLSAPFLGGLSTGWTAYAPLSTQAPPGMDAYIMAIIIFAVSSAVAGANITTTAVTMRARGMTWDRTPIFVYGAVASVGVAIPAFPMFMASQIFSGLDRAMGASFYDATNGGSGWLYANLFWLMGHPEVYVILLPALVALLEIVPVFSRSPLFSFNAAVAGIVGITGLSVLVWAHHMYASGWAPNLNAPFMLTTEIISIPTGLLFLVFIGTIWRGNIWVRLPMIAVYAVLWNFLIGGITGIYLSDVPADMALHGSMYVTAHFHYTLMGAGLTGMIGATAYWFPKMTGRMLNEKFATPAFLIMQVGFQVTFMGMFLVGLEGQPRRVALYDILFANGNKISTMGAYTIFFGALIMLVTIIDSWRHGEVAPANPWGSQTLEWKVPNPIPLENFLVPPVVTGDPYQFGKPDIYDLVADKEKVEV
jgi:cytochrome c oxidase subunit 1